MKVSIAVLGALAASTSGVFALPASLPSDSTTETSSTADRVTTDMLAGSKFLEFANKAVGIGKQSEDPATALDKLEKGTSRQPGSKTSSNPPSGSGSQVSQSIVERQTTRTPLKLDSEHILPQGKNIKYYEKGAPIGKDGNYAPEEPGVGLWDWFSQPTNY